MWKQIATSEKKEDCLIGQWGVCVYMKPLHCVERRKILNEAGVAKEECLLFMKAVEAAGEYGQSLTEINNMDFTRIMYCVMGRR